jgi:hypothetical protein
MQKTKSLSLATLTQEQHDRTCGYWLIVQDYHSPHTAFRTCEGFFRWAEDRGLDIEKSLPAHGEHSYQTIIGQYGRRYIGDVSEIESRIEDQILVLDNAEYTIGYVTIEDGIRVINVIGRGNPRMVFDYRSSQDHIDAGKVGFPAATFVV